MSATANGTGKTTPAKCRSCNRPMDTPLFCSDCHTLHPADGSSYFELLGFEPAYDLDEGDLRRRYLQASREIHPDRHGSEADDAALSVRVSAQLNEAFRVLGDPVLRAEYLLELVGGQPSSLDKSVPQEVLTQTLMLREEIEEARAAGDAATLAGCRQQAQRLHDESGQAAADLARQMPGDVALRKQLRQTLNTVRYYQKILDLF